MTARPPEVNSATARCKSLAARSAQRTGGSRGRSAARPRRKARQAVDAAGVAHAAIRVEAFGTLVRRPVDELRARALVAIARPPVAARVGDAIELRRDDRSRAILLREVGRELVEGGLARDDDAPASIQPHDARRSVEGAEQECDAA